MITSRRVEQYTQALSLELAKLPSAENKEIIAELLTHLEYREAEGRLEQTLADLGTPADYAALFYHENILENTVNHGSLYASIKTLVYFSSKQLIAALGLLISGLLLTSGLALAVSVAAKLAWPETIGLWVSPDGWPFSFGAIDAHQTLTYRDILGEWYAPMVAILATGLLIMGYKVALFFLRLMLKRTKALSRL